MFHPIVIKLKITVNIAGTIHFQFKYVIQSNIHIFRLVMWLIFIVSKCLHIVLRIRANDAPFTYRAVRDVLSCHW